MSLSQNWSVFQFINQIFLNVLFSTDNFKTAVKLSETKHSHWVDPFFKKQNYKAITSPNIDHADYFHMVFIVLCIVASNKTTDIYLKKHLFILKTKHPHMYKLHAQHTMQITNVFFTVLSYDLFKKYIHINILVFNLNFTCTS